MMYTDRVYEEGKTKLPISEKKWDVFKTFDQKQFETLNEWLTIKEDDYYNLWIPK